MRGLNDRCCACRKNIYTWCSYGCAAFYQQMALVLRLPPEKRECEFLRFRTFCGGFPSHQQLVYYVAKVVDGCHRENPRSSMVPRSTRLGCTNSRLGRLIPIYQPKRNFRQRAARNDSDDENEPEKSSSEKKEEVIIPFLEDCSASKQIDKNAARNPVVSFDNEEDDGEVFKVKKSSYSRRLAKMLEKERKQKKKGGNKEAGSSSPNIDSHYDSPSPDNEEIKGDLGEYNRILNGDDADEMELESDAEQGHQFDPVKKVLESGAIPDAAMIHEARKRRQLAREMGDFIPVDDTVRFEKGASRLVRDDDNDRSDEEDEDERISFTVVSAQAEREKVRQAIMDSHRAGSESGSEEHDEEFKRWEDEQIRKGVSIPQIQPAHVMQQPDPNLYQQYMYSGPTVFPTKEMMTPSMPTVVSIPMDYTEELGKVGGMGDSVGASYKKTIPKFTANQNTPESIREKLADRLKSLREVQRAHEREQDSLRSDLTNSELSVHLLEAELPNLTRSFNFYQEMRGYVTDLVECLNEKVGTIDDLERAMHSLLKQRTLRLVLRRQQDVKDQSEEFAKISSKSVGVLDSLTRDRGNKDDVVKIRRAAEREGRRTRRRKARESRSINSCHREGMSSDDEETEVDLTRFQSDKESILMRAENVFCDVVEEFATISGIKKRMEMWKTQQPDSYEDAYVSLCLPKLFGPFVRFQLLTWNPLEETRIIEELAWYEVLLFYGCRDVGLAQDLKRDNDVNLLPLLIEKTLVPKLTDLVENVWDPLSASQTLRLVKLVQQLIEDYPTITYKSKNTQSLLRALVARMKKSLDDDVFVPLYPKSLLENKSVGANAFFQRQFWTCVKLLQNFVSWQNVLSEKTIQELALDGLLNRYILLALQTSTWNDDTLEKCKTVVSILPQSWFANKNDDSPLQQMEMFSRFLKNCAVALEKTTYQGPPRLPLESVAVKDHIREVILMLLHIGAMNHALALVNQFSLKDLKGIVTGNKDLDTTKRLLQFSTI